MWLFENSKYTMKLLCSSPGTENNFNKYDTSTITNFGVSYDYGSVMHYSAYAFSKNGGITIEPKVSRPSSVFLVSTCGF